MAAQESQHAHKLRVLSSESASQFVAPKKKIHGEDDVSFFLSSVAYGDIMTFLLQLNRAMFPLRQKAQELQLSENTDQYCPEVLLLRGLLQRLTSIIDDHPPDTGPRRFGNLKFREWYSDIESQAENLLLEYVPKPSLVVSANDKAESPHLELSEYMLGSFGSRERLDYGSGHELSFLAFITGIWKLGGFTRTPPASLERQIVLGVFVPLGRTS